MSQTPTKEQYENALETVRKYEKRQRQLKALGEELSKKLQEFDQIKFDINKDSKEIIFSGLHKAKGKLMIGKSVCHHGDKYEPVIGKLIAVKNALNESVEDVVKLVENKGYITIGTLDASKIYINEHARC
ncbi:hypothetical protein J1TS3_36350 [Siminovitchia fordii]|uniref:Uncharacterized protein n=2 Tax=Siminovitchia fordii TaxID=254759 RepID=A0ABQ4K9V8_9BACI|nr:hypothetical protein J1TS3_36350 [Siminovitchia fordii]